MNYTELSLEKLKEISSDKKHVKVISFSRNFGKEAAMLAGLRASCGSYVCVIDSDMEQDPKIVLDMMAILEKDQNIDIVAAYQEQRNEGKLLSFFKKCFYNIINSISQVNFHQGVSDFRMFRREVVDAIISLEEQNRFSKGIFSYVGFNNYYLPYTTQPRNAGKSSFNFTKLFNYAIEGIVSFSTKPLRITFVFGFISLIIALISLIMLIFNKTLISILCALIFGMSGLQFIVIGILGEYISQVHIQSKNRPIYVVKHKINLK